MQSHAVGCSVMQCDAVGCSGMQWEGMGGPKSLGLGGICQDVMDCDESPWEGMGRPMASLESSELQRKFKKS